ncbi:MAG: alpha/beta hydrolase [Alphaproteobacteria bacterium]
MSWLGGIVLALIVTSVPLRAEEVKIEQQALDVLGNLEIAKGKSLKQDPVVLLVHDTLGHHRMEIISALQELLSERGVSSLAITLSLGLNERRGMFDCNIEQDHRNEDAVEEIQAWVDWLKNQGAKNIIVAGHSRGGNQAAVYVAKKHDPAVKKAILIAPLAQTPSNIGAEYERRFRLPLQPALAEAEKQMDEIGATALMDGVAFLNCDRAKVTAGAFVNYYGPNQNLYTPSILPFLKMPVLVVVGTMDPLAQELEPAIRGMPDNKNTTLVTIPDADHFFTNYKTEDLADRIKDFVLSKTTKSAQKR